MRTPSGIVVAVVATLTGALAGGFVATALAGPPPATAAPALADAAGVHRDEAAPTEKVMATAVPRVPDAAGQEAPVPVADADTAVVQEAAAETAPAPACAPAPAGTTGSAPSAVSAGGVAGTSSDDIAVFARAYNAYRVANCLQPVPPANFRYDACMEARLFWMAEDPSTDPASAWGHIGSVRSDGAPSVGCDGNLAGGMNNTGDTFARKWWDSTAHRLSLYKPDYTGSTAAVCIYLAVTHGGVPDEPVAFARAAARWGGC